MPTSDRASETHGPGESAAARTKEAPPRRRLSPWRKLAVSAVTAAACLAILEAGLRVLLFHDADWSARLGHRLREEGLYADRWSNRLWVLRHRFTDPQDRKPPPRFDEQLGWLPACITPGTYEHADEAKVAGRRPFLLYGDSFAECVKHAGVRFQDVLEESPLASEWALVNYGTGGYGLDQAVLLFERSIDRWLEREPVVAIGVYVDDDLDRCTLYQREWPKPRFVLDASGALLLESPVIPDVERWIARHPLPATSYVFRYLVYGADVLPRNESEWLLGRGDHGAETKAVCRGILDRLAASLDRLGLQAFVVLFHGERYVEETDWREHFLTAELTRLGIPWVSSRVAILEDARKTGRPIAAYYLQEGPGSGHYGATGNRVVFTSLGRGLSGAFDGP